jgi:hypothetical protein
MRAKKCTHSACREPKRCTLISLLTSLVKWTITRYEVERAVRRAEIFRQRGFTATTTVAGSEISPEVQLVAQQTGCAVVLDGRYEFDQPFRG